MCSTEDGAIGTAIYIAVGKSSNSLLLILLHSLIFYKLSVHKTTTEI